MKNSIVFVAVASFCLITFPTTTVGKNLKGWPNPFLNTGHSFNYGDSKIWKCTYSNGSAPAISISTPGSSTPSTPSPLTPSTPPPTPKTSPPPPTPSPPPPAPKKSLPPPTPSLPPPTPKKSPSTTPTPTLPPPTPKKSPSPPSAPSLPPPTPKKSPSPPPSDDHSSTPSNPPPEHHHSHHHQQQQNPWEHIESCMRNMGPVGMCRWQMEVSFHTRLFRVSNYCCNLVANMKNECDDVAWGFFTDPFFVPLVRYTCHVNC